MDERSLGIRLAGGEPAAFAELYDACADRLFGFLRATLGDPNDAADVMQETFARVVRSRAAFARIENPIAYVFVCARHEASRWRTHSERRRHATLEQDVESPAGSGQSCAGSAHDSPDVAAALAGLPAELREVVHLKIYVGLKFREIAELLGCPQGTVATRYRTALQRLRDELGFAGG